MCGRFSSHVGSDILVKRFEVTENRAYIDPSYNVAPASEIRVITRENPTILSSMYWNYIPNDLRYYDRSRPIINARSERLLELKMYVESFQKRRCLIPVNGFYEWKKAEKTNEPKTPYYIHMRDEAVFALAGIYSNKSPIDKFLKSNEQDNTIVGTEMPANRSCAIITSSPNELMKPIHSRMPVIITKDNEKLWLDRSTDLKELVELFTPISSEIMQVFPVSIFVNSTRNNGQKCIQKIDEEGLHKQKLGLDKEQSSLDEFF
ncbi:MAG: putative SOS response-associated peptidase YedK [Candidatus Heimdallarchaeota archaeon LC_2]|nr:MAG: putative SOS response-associated peptidase YedK [Candidatus Heimdallarchaeota archaeon LC_2]